MEDGTDLHRVVVDDRAVAINIDLLFAVLLVIGGIVFFGAVVLLSLSGAPNDGPRADGTSATDRLGSDILKDDLDGYLLNESCVEDYLAATNNGACWNRNYPTGNDEAFLRQSLGFDPGYSTNVTFSEDRDLTNGGCGSLSRCSVGPELPARDDVATFHRRVGINDSSGGVEFMTMYVSVWQSGEDT